MTIAPKLNVPDWLLGRWQCGHGPSLLAERENITMYIEAIVASPSIFNYRLDNRQSEVFEEQSERSYKIKSGRGLDVTKLSRTRIRVILEDRRWR